MFVITTNQPPPTCPLAQKAYRATFICLLFYPCVRGGCIVGSKGGSHQESNMVPALHQDGNKVNIFTAFIIIK